MKLNKDCVRDVMLAIEEYDSSEILTHDKFLALQQLEKYDDSTKIYTAQKLNEAGYLNGNFDFYMDDTIYVTISSLTWHGHEYLDTIRDPEIWTKTKESVSKISSVSLEIIGEVAKNFVKQKLGLS